MCMASIKRGNLQAQVEDGAGLSLQPLLPRLLGLEVACRVSYEVIHNSGR